MDYSMSSQGSAGSSGSGGGPPGEGQAPAKNKKPTPRGHGKGKKAQKYQSEDEESMLSQESQEPADPSSQVSSSEQSLTGKKKRVHRSKGSELHKKEKRERKRREEREAAAAAATTVETFTAINSPPRSPSPRTMQPTRGSSSGSDTSIRDISAELSAGLVATAQALNESFDTTTSNNPPPVPTSFLQAPGAREEQSGSADKGEEPEAAGSPSSGKSTPGAFTFHHEVHKESDSEQGSGRAAEAERHNENKEHQPHPETSVTSAAEHKDFGWESQDKNIILPPIETETPRTSGGDNSDNKSASETMAAADYEAELEKLRERNRSLERRNAGLAADVDEQNAEATKHSERADMNLKASQAWEKKFNEANITNQNLRYNIRNAEMTIMSTEKARDDMKKALKDSEAAKTALTKNLREALVEAKQTGDTLKEVHVTSNEKREELEAVKRERDDLKSNLDTARAEVQGIEAAFDEIVNNNTELQEQLGLIRSQLEDQRKELEHSLGLQVAKRDMPGEQETPASAKPASKSLEDELKEAGDTTNEEDPEPSRTFALIPDNLGKEFIAKVPKTKLFNSDDLRALDAASFTANWKHWSSNNSPPAHPHYNRSFVRFMINAFTGEQIIGLEAVIHWYAESRVRGFFHNLNGLYYVDKNEIWRIPDEHQPSKRMEGQITETPYPPEDIPDPPSEDVPPKVEGSTQGEDYRAENSDSRIQISSRQYGGMFGEFDDEDVKPPEDGRPWIITDEDGEVPNIKRPGVLPSEGKEGEDLAGRLEGDQLLRAFQRLQKHEPNTATRVVDELGLGSSGTSIPNEAQLFKAFNRLLERDLKSARGVAGELGLTISGDTITAIPQGLSPLGNTSQPRSIGNDAETPKTQPKESGDGGGGDDPLPPQDGSGTTDDQQKSRPSLLHSPFSCLATLITDLLQWLWYWARRLYTLIFGGYLSTIRFQSPVTFSDEVDRSPPRPNIPRGFWIWLNALLYVAFMLATSYVGHLWWQERYNRNMWREANGVTQDATFNWRDDQITQIMMKARRLSAEVNGNLEEASSLLATQDQTFNDLLHDKAGMSRLNGTHFVPEDVLEGIISNVISQHSTTLKEQPVSQSQSEPQKGKESVTSTDQSQQSKKSIIQAIKKFSQHTKLFFKGIYPNSKPQHSTTRQESLTSQPQNKFQNGKESITSTVQSQQSEKSSGKAIDERFSQKKEPVAEVFKELFSKAKAHAPAPPFSQHSSTRQELPASQSQSKPQEGQGSVTSTDQYQPSKKSIMQAIKEKFSQQKKPFAQAFKGIFSTARIDVPAPAQDEDHAQQRNENLPGRIGIVISQNNSPLHTPQADPVPTGPKSLIQRMLEAIIPQFIPKVSMTAEELAALDEHTQMEIIYETQDSSGIRTMNGHRYYPESKSMRELREKNLPRWARISWYYLKHSNKLLPRGSWKNEDVTQPWQEPWEEWVE